MSNSSNASLVKRLNQGDSASLTALYDRHSTLVYSVALRVLHNPASAEEVSREIFWAMWRYPERFANADESLGGLLALLARNRSVDLLRKGLFVSDDKNHPILVSFDLGRFSSQSVMCEKMREIVNGLSSDHRNMLNLTFFEGMNLGEISAATGCSVENAKLQLRSALIALRVGIQVKAS